MPLIQALRSALQQSAPPKDVPEKPKPEEYSHLSYAIWRFLRSWALNGTIGPDEAVLFRQIARWQPRELFIGTIPDELSCYGKLADFEITHAGNLCAAPFKPSWLHSNAIEEKSGIDPRPAERRCDESLWAEPYIHFLGYPRWQSQAQKEATWMMLRAPSGSTSLVALPTGSGKSLCFQAVSRFSPGVTIVVVPTVALAIDQWRSACEVVKDVPDLKPLYYASDDRALDPILVAERIRNGETRLVFTSPEACVSGRLRSLIEELVHAGRLSNLVVDEAHIIESWGMFFRVDFQLLSSLRRKWLGMSENSFRTYLLSATFTPQTRTILKNLFGGEGIWLEFVSQRLRPEINYYRQLFGDEHSRDNAVLECAWKLPRPAIFYTTEVEEAKRLFARLRSNGFLRIGCFTGETRSVDRRKLLEDWRSDGIDLMVATSAFGLGVDKADIRTVVHACLPENPHRYYQEVGRGGRDGNSSIAILLPSKQDIAVAKGMAPKMLSREIAQERWEALWQSAKSIENENYVYRINTAARRTELKGVRTYKENIRWNKRLLLQLLRAGKLDILDIEYMPSNLSSDDMDEWVKVRLRFSPESPSVAESIDKVRQYELDAATEGLEQIISYVRGDKSICRILKKLYGPDVQRACSGCPNCRIEGRPYNYCDHLEFDVRDSEKSDHIMITEVADLLEPTNIIKWRGTLRRLVQHLGIRRFAVAPEFMSDLRALVENAFPATAMDLYRLDALDASQPVIFSGERLVVFHIRKFDSRTKLLQTGKEVFDFVCKSVRVTDSSGRVFGEADGWKLYNGIERWMTETNTHVY